MSVSSEPWKLTLRDGNQVCVPASLEVITSYVLLEQEDWFEQEIHFVRRLLEPGMNAIDVGANFGLYSLAMARRVGANGKVWSIEPTELPRSHLECSLQLNGFAQVELHGVALSSFDGRGTMRVSDGPELSRLESGDPAGGEPVRVMRLDTLCAECGIGDVELLKLDAEGAEEPILDGAETFLRAEQPLVMFEIRQDERVNTTLVDRFRKLGFEPYRLVPGLSLLAPVDSTESLDPFQLNLFAATPERAATLSARGLVARGWAEGIASIGAVGADGGSPFEELPFARGLVAHWASTRGQNTAGERDRYDAALSAYFMAHDTRRTPEERCGLLAASVRQLEHLATSEPRFPRLSSLARVAAELGERELCLRALRSALDLLGRGALDLDEPFLPINPRFDAIEPGEALQDWIVVGILEQLERKAAFSSFFAGTDYLDLLEELRGRQFLHPESERRRQLKRMRGGLQAVVEPHPLLSGADCRNSEFWNPAPH